MNYEQTIAKAAGTNPEILKASLMAVCADIDVRLSRIEEWIEKQGEDDGS